VDRNDLPTALSPDSPTWTVRRHAGHARARWHTLFTGSYDQAHARFYAVWATVRRGSVALHRPDGSMAFKESLPPPYLAHRGKLFTLHEDPFEEAQC